MKITGLEIDMKAVDRESLRIEGDQVVDADYTDGTKVPSEKLVLLTDMHQVSSLV